MRQPGAKHVSLICATAPSCTNWAIYKPRQGSVGVGGSINDKLTLINAYIYLSFANL